MPFYDLCCTGCENEFKVMASIADRTENRISCPECGSHNLEAVFKSAPYFIKNLKAPDCPSRHICGSGCCHARER